MKKTVLVTGASGFIAMHTILKLLEAGYAVRGTVRSEARASQVRDVLSQHDPRARDIELVLADLSHDKGWPEAMEGTDLVLHVASPLPKAPPKHEDELIVPARDGALRVLRAAVDAKVERVVMTSSVAAVIYGHRRDGTEVYDESHWSRLGDDVGAYEKSKTIAERAAWDYIEGLAEGERISFCTINPGLVLGPVLGRDFSTSGEVVRKLMTRELPGCPDVGWAIVDVRDVAAAHVAALETKEAEGHRFIVAIEHASMSDIAHILQRAFGPEGYRIPTRRLPSWLLKTVSIFDKTARLAVPELGLRQDVKSAHAESILGLDLRTREEMVVDMGRSMIEHGVVTR